MYPPRLSILTALVALLLAGCGKDDATGATAAAGEENLPKPDAVGGSVTGMPDPGQSTPHPGEPVDVPPAEDLETPDSIVPLDGEAPADAGNGMPQTAMPDPPEPETMPAPPADAATPASGTPSGTPGAP